MRKAPLEKWRSNDAGSARTVLNDVRTNEGCGGPGLEKRSRQFPFQKIELQNNWVGRAEDRTDKVGWEGERT